MKYLLLSVLVVCMVGILMIPNTFAQTSEYTITIVGGKGCEVSWSCFEPYTLWIPSESTVRFYNPTDELYAISGGSQDDTNADLANFLVPAGQYATIPFTLVTEEVISYTDNLHPWMYGEIVVGDIEYVPSNVLGGQMSIATSLSLSELASSKSDQITVPISKEIFDRKKTDILSSLGYNQGFPYHFGLDRDFTKEQGVTETNYQLYKVIDSQTNKHVGDLKFYLGSSEWWDENAELQEDDTSGFENIFKVKIFLMHKTEPVMVQQMTDHLTTALHILVPEWSNEVDDVLDYWFVDSINFSERNENGKRENSIMTENKEIKVFHDDLDYGSITVIVTENADTISLGGVSTESDVLDELLSAEKTVSEESKASEGCGEGTVLVNGVCQLAPTQSKTPFTSIEPHYIIIGVVAIGGIIGAIAVAKRGSKTPKPTKEKQKPVKRKPAKKKETSASCENCGNSLKKTAKFCGKCGTPRA